MIAIKWLKWPCVALAAGVYAVSLTACGDGDSDSDAESAADSDGANTVVVVTNQTTVVTNTAPQEGLVAPQLVTPADGKVYTTLLEAGTGYGVHFEWTVVPGATSYILELNGEPKTVTGTTVDTELVYGDYEWRVWARNASGAGPASGMLSFTIKSSILPLPSF